MQVSPAKPNFRMFSRPDVDDTTPVVTLKKVAAVKKTIWKQSKPHKIEWVAPDDVIDDSPYQNNNTDIII